MILRFDEPFHVHAWLVFEQFLASFTFFHCGVLFLAETFECSQLTTEAVEDKLITHDISHGEINRLQHMSDVRDVTSSEFNQSGNVALLPVARVVAGGRYEIDGRGVAGRGHRSHFSDYG